MNLQGKKLLIIGGAFQHCKLVEAAKNLGVITYVIDYLPLELAPAKQIADYHFEVDIFAIDEVVALCRQHGIEGVLATHLDTCQLPYFQVCKKLGLPCYGTEKQFQIFTDKTLFKQFLLDNGLDTIPQYEEKHFLGKEECLSRVEFPVFVKPCISCNSKGQTICKTYEEAVEAIRLAKQISLNGEVLIEKYMDDCDDFAITLLVLNGKVQVLRTGDRYRGEKEEYLDRFGVYCPWPSKHTELFVNTVFPKLKRAILNIGIDNAPIFIQGFVDGEKIRFYDPGLRFPGFEYERVYERVYERNVVDIFIKFALAGSVEADEALEPRSYELRGNVGACLYFMVRPGEIDNIQGVEEVKAHPNVVCFYQRYQEGTVVEATYNSKQSFAEVYILADSKKERKEILDFIYSTLKVSDAEGNDMRIARVNEWNVE